MWSDDLTNTLPERCDVDFKTSIQASFVRARFSTRIWLSGLIVLSSSVQLVSASDPIPVQEAKAADPQQLLDDFKAKWDATKWEKRFRGKKYMRTTGDTGWKLRMTTLRSLVLLGEAAVPTLTDALDSDHDPTRVLAAQTLSFLAPHADVDRVKKALAEDKNQAVRLYAADILGMSGKGKAMDWEQLTDPQRNRDVRKHLDYAADRGNNAISDEVIKTMKSWDPSLMDSAKVGSVAPDFRLKTIDGKEIALSDYRGKQPVVLIFVYGDT